MITSLRINGYRGFSHFEMGGLGRVNLLVGKNNGGKTSVLEMIHLLGSGPDPSALWKILSRRGERVMLEQGPQRRGDLELEVLHLFHGHDPSVGANFTVSAKNGKLHRSVICALVEPSNDSPSADRLPFGDESGPPKLFLALMNTPKREPDVALPLTRRFGLNSEAIDFGRRSRGHLTREQSQIQFVSTESLSPDTLAFMWNDIALTDAQKMVVRALSFVEPKIEAIAPQIASSNYYYPYPMSRGAFIVKLRGLEAPVPIGSLGDGTWRILALGIALARAKDGILLVDEIDTGLHHSVMSKMWTLIAETARDLNVQVFATTHSYDCVQSLATICTNGRHDVTLQRIEAGNEHSIPYTPAEILQAARNRIEVR